MTDTRDRFEKWFLSYWPTGANLLHRDSEGIYQSLIARDQWTAWQAALQAGAGDAHVVPAGWTLVPIEPSWDMRNEGREFLIDGLEKEPEKLAYFLWKTMVAASPIELEKRDAAIDSAQATEGK